MRIGLRTGTLVLALLASCGNKKAAEQGSGSGSGSGLTTGSGSAAGSGSDLTAGSATGSGARPASVSAEMAVVADKMLAALVKLATDLEAAKGDCKVATTTLVAAQTEAKAIAAEAAKFDKSDKDPEAKAWFEKNYMPNMLAALDKLGAVAETCKADPAFVTAMKDYMLLPHKDAAPAKVDRPAAVTDQVVAIVNKAMGLVDKFAVDVAAAGTDCVKATAAVKANTPAMISVNDEMQKLQTKPDPDVEAWLKATHGDKLETSMKKAMPTMEACKNDAAFVEAMKKLPL